MFGRSSAKHIKSTSVLNPHNSNDQASRKTSQRYGSYTKFWLSYGWYLKYVIFWKKSRMCYDQGRQSNNFSHASNQPQNIMGVCMAFSLHITVWSFGYEKLSLPPHTIGTSLWCKAPQFSPVQYMDRFRSKIPSLPQQDTSVKASDVRNWIFLNKQPEEKLLRYGT